MPPFSKVAIIGPGLLGGSIGLSCQRQAGIEVAFWGRSEQKLHPVRKAGFMASTDLAPVITGADLIILALPVTLMATMATQLVAAGLTPDQLVTDVGSVKASVIDSVQPILGTQGYRFIGAHPMAGSEQAGFSAATADLVSGATCILTPDAYTDADSLQALHQFWQGIGMITRELAPAQHDEIISRVSHVPHLLASVCAHVALPEGDYGAFSGGGLRDTSRVASGDAALWTGIISENSTAITAHLGEAITRLTAYQTAVKFGDLATLQALLQEDKDARDSYFQG